MIYNNVAGPGVEPGLGDYEPPVHRTLPRDELDLISKEQLIKKYLHYTTFCGKIQGNLEEP